MELVFGNGYSHVSAKTLVSWHNKRIKAGSKVSGRPVLESIIFKRSI